MSMKNLYSGGARRRALSAADIAKCALFTSLMIVGAFVKIPFPFVPLTFQTAFAVLAGLLLGPKKGAISVGCYMLLGLIGIPVFTSGGGIGYVMLPSFGYIIGFVAAAAVAGFSIKFCKRPAIYMLIALAAVAVNYIVGIAYFIAVWQISGYENLASALITYNVLYIPKDVVLAAIAAIVAIKLNRMQINCRHNAEKE